MTSQRPVEELGGLSLDSIARLIGASRAPALSPSGDAVSVTFRPLPPGFNAPIIESFLRELEDELLAQGAKVVPWALALEQSERSCGLRLRDDIQGVFDVPLHRSSEDHVSQYVPDFRTVQWIGVTNLDDEQLGPTTSFAQRLKLGLDQLVTTLCPVVLSVDNERISIIAMNLSDAVLPRSDLAEFVQRSLIPRMVAPIHPIPLSSFQQGRFHPNKDPRAAELRKLASGLRPSQLFPPGTELRNLVLATQQSALALRLFEELTEGRTGVSYGFNALATPPVYYGDKVDPSDWAKLYPIPGTSHHQLRQSSRGRWYLRFDRGEGEVIAEVPDIWVYSSRSGAPSKTDLAPDEDVVRVGLVRGRLHFQIAEGLELDSDICPSFDTGVMLAISLAAALRDPESRGEAMPIVHFHGYPSTSWFAEGEYFGGQHNPEFSCGTTEAALLSFTETWRLCTKGKLELGCIVEPGHGSVLIGRSIDSLLERIAAGCGVQGAERLIELGGRFLPELREQRD